jgi:hypothetical protein
MGRPSHARTRRPPQVYLLTQLCAALGVGPQSPAGRCGLRLPVGNVGLVVLLSCLGRECERRLSLLSGMAVLRGLRPREVRDWAFGVHEPICCDESDCPTQSNGYGRACVMLAVPPYVLV